MEAGDVGSLGKTPAARKALAQQAVEAGAPAEFFGLDELQGITRTEAAELLRGLRSSSATLQESPTKLGVASLFRLPGKELGGLGNDDAIRISEFQHSLPPGRDARSTARPPRNDVQIEPLHTIRWW